MKFMDWKLWVIVVLTGVIVLLILFQPKSQPNLDKIKTLEIGIAHADLEKKELKDKHEQDSTKSAQKIAELRDSLANEKRHGVKLTISLRDLKAKPEVIKIVQENPIIDTVFRYYDSLLIGKDQELAIQDAIIKSQEVENKRITENFTARLKLTEEQYEKQKELTDIYKGQVRKEKGKVKLVKVVAVIGSVGAFILGSQL